MKKRKTLAMGLAVAMAVSCLAGCGGDDKKASSDGKTEQVLNISNNSVVVGLNPLINTTGPDNSAFNMVLDGREVFPGKDAGQAAGGLLGKPEKGAHIQTGPKVHLHTKINTEQCNQKLPQKACGLIQQIQEQRLRAAAKQCCPERGYQYAESGGCNNAGQIMGPFGKIRGIQQPRKQNHLEKQASEQIRYHGYRPPLP